MNRKASLALIVLAGGLFAGCESSPVNGQYSFRDRNNVYGDTDFQTGSRLTGPTAFRSGQVQSNVDRAETASGAIRPADLKVVDAPAPAPRRDEPVVGAPRADEPRADALRTEPIRSDQQYRDAGPAVRSDTGAVVAPPAATPTAPAEQPNAQSTAQADRKADNPAGKPDPDRAVFAGIVSYPADALPAGGLNATTSVDRQANTLTIRNGSDQPMKDARVWIDGRYVAAVNDVPANGSVTLKRGDFADKSGGGIADFNTFDKIEVQAGDKLYSLPRPQDLNK
jgi:hypothetical protein